MLLKDSNALLVKNEATCAQTSAVPYQCVGYKYVDNGFFLDKFVKTKSMDVKCQ